MLQYFVPGTFIGAKKTEQFEDNLKAIDVSLTPEELQKLDDISKLPPEYPGWMLERQGQDRKQE